jgi:mannose-6-phosphate isomerase-like protein (cupin superfamily)
MLLFRLVAIIPLTLAILSVPRLAAADDITYFDAKQVAASFAKATTLYQHDNYRIVTGRRVKPGEVEIHALDTDLMYVVSGSATLVTGGTPVEPRDTAPSEVRAKSSQGGTPHRLSKGDVIIIPKGTPHWFEQVSGTFDYLTIKVR